MQLLSLVLLVAAPLAVVSQAIAGTEGFITDGYIDDKKPAFTPGGKVVKTRVGPWTLKAKATLPNRPVSPPKPCQDCFLVNVGASLEYENGDVANINTGMWLHHMVLTASGNGQKDVVCPRGGMGGRRIFASGNERSAKRVNRHGKWGIKVNPADRWMSIVELMNESDVERTVYMTLTYEYVEGAAAAGYKDMHLIWLDATGCGASDVPAQKGQYQLRTPPFKSTVAGRLAFGLGHTHDGGVNTTIFQNGKPICVSKMQYAGRPEFIEPAGGADHGDGHGAHGMQHISASGLCLDFGDLAVGDELVGVSYYDADKYPQMMHDGKMHPVMGNVNIYVGPK